MTDCSLKRRASDKDDTCPYVAEAADRAVKKVFAILGVDVDKPESVEAFREDLRFGRKLRKAADHSGVVFVAVVVTGMAYAAWDGIRSAIKGH